MKIVYVCLCFDLPDLTNRVNMKEWPTQKQHKKQHTDKDATRMF